MDSRISWKNVFLIFLFCILFVFLCFGNALDYYFAKEDFNNLDIGNANKFIERVTPNSMIYRPLANYGYFAVGRIFFGLNPRLWHCSNLVLHALAGLLVCLVFYKVTRNIYTGFFAGLLYLANLVNFHLIYWVTCATQTLALITAMAAWLLYLAAQEPENPRARLFCVIVFALALLTNEVNVVIPLMTMVYWWLFSRRSENGKVLLSLNLRLWAVLACYIIMRGIGYWIGGGETYRHFYDISLRTQIPRNIVEMLVMIIDPLYLLSSFLVEKKMLPGRYALLLNWPVGAAVIFAAIVCYVKKAFLVKVFQANRDMFKYLAFGVSWTILALIPSSYIPQVHAWRTNLAAVGYSFILACLITRLSKHKAFYGIAVACIFLWGWWGMSQIRKYDAPYIQIDRYQKICRNIASDTELYLQMFPDVEELLIPSSMLSKEFHFATFGSQQFQLLLPERVTYLYSPYEHDKSKSMLILVYSEEDSRLYLGKVVRPEKATKPD